MHSISYVAGGFIECFAITCMFYGITVAQAYVYSHTCEHDPKWMKRMAGLTMVLETVHTVILLRKMYFYTVQSMEDPSKLSRLSWTIPAALITEIAIEIIVEGFYIHRLWIFTKNVVLATAVILVLIARGITFVYLGAKSTSLASFHSFDEVTPKVLIITTHSLAIVLDSTLATIMLCYLYHDRAALPRTNEVMTWLMIYYVNTGVVLASLSIAILITYLAIPDSLLYVGLTDIFAKVIANSFFGALNSRQLLRTRLADPVVISALAFASAPVASSMVDDQLANDQAEKGITMLQK